MHKYYSTLPSKCHVTFAEIFFSVASVNSKCVLENRGMIDGVPIETSYQAWNELMRCKKSGKKYQAPSFTALPWRIAPPFFFSIDLVSMLVFFKESLFSIEHLGSFKAIHHVACHRHPLSRRSTNRRSISPKMRLPFVKIRPRPKRSVHEKPSRIRVGLVGCFAKVVKDA